MTMSDTVIPTMPNPIKTEDLVDLVSENGILDVLTKSSKSLVDEYYSNDNITASDLAQFIIQLYSANVANAIQFLTQKDQADLIKQKIISELGQTSDIDFNGNKITGLVGAQIEVAKAQARQIESATKIAEEQAQKQLELLDAQIALSKQQAESFRTDAALKYFKFFMDSWNVRKTSDTDTPLYEALDREVFNGLAKSVGEVLGFDLSQYKDF